MSQNVPVRKTVTARMEELRSILHFVTDFAAQVKMTDESIYYLKLAVDEAATNIIEHAYEQMTGEITVEIVAQQDDLIITLIDNGTPFDPYSVPQPDLTAPIEQRTPGGLGVYLMYTVMDEVSYEPGPPTNRLTMVKRKHA